jgi:drug/metabolite transporter (DMT)-like permease
MTTIIQTSTRAQRGASYFSSFGFFVLVLCSAIWGSGTVLSKYTLDYFSPLLLLTVEITASCITLWTLVFISGQHKKLRWRDWQHGAGGILEPGLAYILLTVGLSKTSATNSTLILALEALMVGILAWVFLREKLSRAFWVCGGIALVGAGLLSLSGVANATSGASVEGDVLMVVGTFFASLYIVVSRRSVAVMPPALLAALQHTCGLVIVCTLTLIQGEFAITAMPPLSVWLMAAFSGMMQYALAFVLYLTALRYVSAGKSALFLLLIPVFGVVSAMLFLGETLTLGQALGGMLIIGALLPVQWAEANEDNEEQTAAAHHLEQQPQPG